jgi:disulfide bond formation protein DsbB
MNPLSWSFRTSFSVAAVITAALIGFALYVQHGQGLEPCPLCIFQRYAFFLFLMVCIGAAAHAPRGRAGRVVWGVLAMASAATGAGFAIRHLWLQSQPADPLVACAPSLDFMWETMPLGNVLTKVFSGSADCSKVDWAFLGLSMPGWTLVWFAIFFAGAAYYGLRRYPR